MDEVLNLCLGLLGVVVAGCLISWERRNWRIHDGRTKVTRADAAAMRLDTRIRRAQAKIDGYLR